MKIIAWIRKAPLLLWLFLVLTQLLGMYASYNRWQTALSILAEWRKDPALLQRGIERMEGVALAEYRSIWASAIAFIVFSACAVIKRREKTSP